MRHTVFGPAQPYGQSAPTDGTPSIRLASIFYLLAGQTWPCTGGRVFIPNFPGVLNTGIRIMAWTGAHETPIALTDETRLRSVDAVTPAVSGWAEVEWAPFDVVGGATAVAIGYEFLTAVSTYLFTSAAAVGTDAVQAVDGSPLFLAEQGYTGGRSRFRSPAASGSTGNSLGWYGSDIITDDGADPEGITGVYNDQSGQLWVLHDGTPKPVLSAVKS